MGENLKWNIRESGEMIASEKDTSVSFHCDTVNLKRPSGDQDFKDILQNIKSTNSLAVINYGASWCGVCSQIFPVFCKLSYEFQNISFIYTDIDGCPEETRHIRYTPTFHFYRDGERVDEMFGIGEERLHDRLWLHS